MTAATPASADLCLPLSGATRLVAIVGDPIAQVKSPAGVTRALQGHGRNAIVIPVHASPADLAECVRGLSKMQNLDGIIVTVPHKFAMHAFCATATDRAQFLGAVNTLRRNADGSWHGDMVDGIGFVRGIREAGCQPQGARALLIGAGGAGSAIAWSMLDAGVAELAIHDGDRVRRDALIERLRGRYGERVCVGSDDPRGFDLVLNASPCGMQASDPSPVPLRHLNGEMFVADVITAPAVTPLVQAARDLGCKTQVGGGMFAAVCDLMVDFLLEAGPLARVS